MPRQTRPASSSNSTSSFTPAELRKLRSLNTPEKIQRFLDELPYHHADTSWSPRRVLRERTAHCLEGALLAAAALRVNGQRPLVMDLQAVRDVDHVIAVYRDSGHFGAIGKSNYAGLRFRAPVYRTIRELALSYFNDYFNLRGERTLRGYSELVDLSRFDSDEWMTSEKSVWTPALHLVEDARHFALFPAQVVRDLPRMDRRSFEAGLHGHLKH